jgi:SAM-dependent methyltransferase
MFKVFNPFKKSFICPVCDYKGPFKDLHPDTGSRKHAQCPKCKSLERHRIQHLVLNKVLNGLNTSILKMIHFAPEPFFWEYFSMRFEKYETADLFMDGVDHKVDIQDLPFEDQSFDFVFASHVLEHVPNDEKAIAEIRRILTSNGIAILPVPIVTQQTINYPEPNPNESGHIRAPGFNYFDRYRLEFSEIKLFDSTSFSEKYQLYIYEDRSHYPTHACPLRTPMRGEKHSDIVPVCYC